MANFSALSAGVQRALALCLRVYEGYIALSAGIRRALFSAVSMGFSGRSAAFCYNHRLESQFPLFLCKGAFLNIILSRVYIYTMHWTDLHTLFTWHVCVALLCSTAVFKVPLSGGRQAPTWRSQVPHSFDSLLIAYSCLNSTGQIHGGITRGIYSDSLANQTRMCALKFYMKIQQ